MWSCGLKVIEIQHNISFQGIRQPLRLKYWQLIQYLKKDQTTLLEIMKFYANFQKKNLGFQESPLGGYFWFWRALSNHQFVHKILEKCIFFLQEKYIIGFQGLELPERVILIFDFRDSLFGQVEKIPLCPKKNIIKMDGICVYQHICSPNIHRMCV